MSFPTEKQWAAEYINGPLTEPQPSEETGLLHSSNYNTGSSSSAKQAPAITVRENLTGASTNTNPFRRGSNTTKPSASVHVRNVSNDKNASSSHVRNISGGSNTSPRIPSSSRHDAFVAFNDGNPGGRRNSDLNGAGQIPTERRRRASSLKERFPGDNSVHPLEVIKKETKAANRAPHLRKHHIPGADSIDQLDNVNGRYHHEGPYDAALLARNTSFTSSPVAALSETNKEALKATPMENIRNSLEGKRPLDGTAAVPSGTRDEFGRLYEYEEGTDMMIEDGGNYKRWPGVEYHPDDLKGKGEPAFTIERQMKEREERRKTGSPRNSTYIELADRSRTSVDGSSAAETSGHQERYSDWEHERRRDSTGHRFSGELKRRIGSLRSKDKQPATS